MLIKPAGPEKGVHGEKPISRHRRAVHVSSHLLWRGGSRPGGVYSGRRGSAVN